MWSLFPEAFLDVSECLLHQGSATRIATEIRDRVRDEVGITISAGIAPNKFLAKIASDWNKPDGQFTVTPDEIDDFMVRLPVNRIFGVGSVTARKMSAMDVQTCGDLQQISASELVRRPVNSAHDCTSYLEATMSVRSALTVFASQLAPERTFANDLPTLTACNTELQGSI